MGKSDRVVDTRPSPAAAMAAAVAEVNVTRPYTSHAHTLGDARRDYRVAVADARDAYERAVAQAEGDAARAEMRAENTLAVATARARAVAARRSAVYARVRYTLTTEQIVQLYDAVTLQLATNYLPYSAGSERTERVCQQRMLARELRRREEAAQ